MQTDIPISLFRKHSHTQVCHPLPHQFIEILQLILLKKLVSKGSREKHHESEANKQKTENNTLQLDFERSFKVEDYSLFLKLYFGKFTDKTKMTQVSTKTIFTGYLPSR